MEISYYRFCSTCLLTIVLFLKSSLLAAAPLELASDPLVLNQGVAANVLFMMDNSASMDRDIVTGDHYWYRRYWGGETDYTELVKNGNWRVRTLYGACPELLEQEISKIFDEPQDINGHCGAGNTALIQMSLESDNPVIAEDAFQRDWRVRSADFNRLYFNPFVNYQPWAHPDFNSSNYESVRANPAEGTRGYDYSVNLASAPFVFEVAIDDTGFRSAYPQSPQDYLALADIGEDIPGNHLVDLWDSHYRYTVNKHSEGNHYEIVEELITYDPSRGSAAQCTGTDAYSREIDQRMSPGQWNDLGAFYFDPGESRIILQFANPANGESIDADAIRLQPLAPGSEIIIDNNESTTLQLGDWRKANNEGSWPDLQSGTVFSQDPEAAFIWRPVISQSGIYRVSARWAVQPAASQAARYIIVPHDKSSDLVSKPPYRRCLGARIEFVNRYSGTTPGSAESGQGIPRLGYQDVDTIVNNIANWYLYGRKRHYVLKSALARTLDKGPDYHFGLGTIHDGLIVPITRGLAANEKTFRQSMLASYFARENRPGSRLQDGMVNAGNYFRGIHASLDSPVIASCQQNHTVVMTDGHTGGTLTFSSGDVDGDGIENTLADTARYYFLPDVLPNRPDEADSEPERMPTQMLTHTAVIGNRGNLFDRDGDGLPDTDASGNIWSYPDIGGNWGDSSTCIHCPQSVDDLRHAAFNGGGSFLGAGTIEEYSNGLVELLQNLRGGEATFSGLAISTTSLARGPHLYQALFNSENWSGDVRAYEISTGKPTIHCQRGEATGKLCAYPSEPIWSALAVNHPLGNVNSVERQMITFDPASGRGIPFLWSSLAMTQKSLLNSRPYGSLNDGRGELRVAYLRGDRTAELSAGGGFRNRTGMLGDIVNSKPLYVGSPGHSIVDGSYRQFVVEQQSRPHLLFVGSNDGMLHAFDPVSGAEVFAYVPVGNIHDPQAPFGRLNRLTSPQYGHEFFVDGSPTVADAYFSSHRGPDRWRSVLVAGMSAGGRMFYAIDITAPTKNLSEELLKDIVLWEFSDADDPDLGYTYSKPAIVKVRAGADRYEWVTIAGNGYNNTGSGEAGLFVLKLRGPTGVIESSTRQYHWELNSDYFKLLVGTVAGNFPNGLSTPSPIDADGDDVIDYVFAGDLSGNVWKFDLTAENPVNWSTQRLFNVADAGLAMPSLPITARPEVAVRAGGRMGSRCDLDRLGDCEFLVYFGTGKYLEPKDNQVDDEDPRHIIFGLRDRNDGETIRGELLEQSVLDEFSNKQADVDGDAIACDMDIDESCPTVRTVSDRQIVPGRHDGWYLTLPSAGERVVNSPILRHDRVIYTTMVPDAEACGNNGSSWLLEFDMLNGGRLDYSPFDFNGDGQFSVGDYLAVDLDDGQENVTGSKIPASGKRSAVGMTGSPTIVVDRTREYKYSSGSRSGVEVVVENPGRQAIGRVSWRQLH